MKTFHFQAASMSHAKFDELIVSSWRNSGPLIPFLKKFVNAFNKSNRETFHNFFFGRKLSCFPG